MKRWTYSRKRYTCSMKTWTYSTKRCTCSMETWTYSRKRCTCSTKRCTYSTNRWTCSMKRWTYSMKRYTCSMKRWTYSTNTSIFWKKSAYSISTSGIYSSKQQHFSIKTNPNTKQTLSIPWFCLAILIFSTTVSP